MSKRSLPTVVSSIPRDLRTFIDRLRDMLTDGSADRIITARELANAGVVSILGNGALALPEGSSLVQSPPAPTNVAATGAVANIFVEWDAPIYRGHAYAEIWSSPTDDLGAAVLVGMAPGSLFLDAVGFSTTRYYWVRFVNALDEKGPYNGISGTSDTTAVDVDYLLGVLEGEITESQLYTDLSTKINDSADGVSYLATQNGIRVQASSDGKTVIGGFGVMGSVDAEKGPTIDFGVLANSFYVAAPATATGIESAIPFIVQTTPTTINGVEVPIGVYMRDAFIQNGTITNAKIANLAVDDAKIADLSAEKITAGTISADRIAANSLTADKIDTRGLSIKDGAGNVILAAGSALNWSMVGGAGKPADGATSGSNLVKKSIFSDGSMGGWNGSGVCATCHGGVGELDVTVRDTLEIGNDFYVTPGETLFAAADIYTGASSYPASAGVMFTGASGSAIGWAGVPALAAGQDWTRRQSSFTVPSGAIKATPWLQIDGPGGQTLPYVAFSRIYVGRQQEGATVGAPAGTYVAGILAQDVESQSGAQAKANAAAQTANWSQITNVPAFGNFAYLSSITSANIGTYIEGAAIGEAYIADAAITQAKIGSAAVGSAQIANLAVDTLRIKDNAVTESVGFSASQYSYNMTTDMSHIPTVSGMKYNTLPNPIILASAVLSISGLRYSFLSHNTWFGYAAGDCYFALYALPETSPGVYNTDIAPVYIYHTFYDMGGDANTTRFNLALHSASAPISDTGNVKFVLVFIDWERDAADRTSFISVSCRGGFILGTKK